MIRRVFIATFLTAAPVYLLFAGATYFLNWECTATETAFYSYETGHFVNYHYEWVRAFPGVRAGPVKNDASPPAIVGHAVKLSNAGLAALFAAYPLWCCVIAWRVRAPGRK